jgi:enoyl-CoA hydratase/carnithine racemase
VRTGADRDVWRITLDHPEAGNALDPQMAHELEAAIALAHQVASGPVRAMARTRSLVRQAAAGLPRGAVAVRTVSRTA